MAYSRLQNPSLLLSLLLVITTMALTNFPEVHAARSLPQISVLSSPLKPPTNIALTLKSSTSAIGINSVPSKPPTNTIGINLAPFEPPSTNTIGILDPFKPPSTNTIGINSVPGMILDPFRPPTHSGPEKAPSASLTQNQDEHLPSFTEFSNNAESIYSGPEKAPSASLTQDEDEHRPSFTEFSNNADLSPAVETTLLDIGVSPTSEVHGQGDLSNIAIDTIID